MASEIVGELRRGSGAISRGDKGRLNLTMQVDFLVVSDDKFASREEILLFTQNAPVVGLQYGPLNATCISKTVERNETNPLYWEMKCEFDTAQEEQQQNPEDPQNPNPITWIPIWKLRLQTEDSETLWQDYDPAGFKTISNTAGELYDPLPNRKQTLISWVFNQFEDPGLSLAEISSRHNKINAGPIRGFPQWTLLCQIEDAELGWYNGFYAWNIAYLLTYRDDDWRTIAYSWGWNYLDNGTLKPWLKDSVQVFGPLDANGGKAAWNTSGHLKYFFLTQTKSFSFLR